MRATTAAIVTVLALLCPAAAQAWYVDISITGAGRVYETTDANEIDEHCPDTIEGFASPGNTPTGTIGATCRAGDATGDYGQGWVIRYVAEAASGYSFAGWQSDGRTSPGPVLCDGSNGSSNYSGAACQFATFANLQVRARFVDVTSPTMSSLTGPSQAVNGPTTFTFAGPADPTRTGFECRVANVHDWTACSSGRSEDPPSSGQYTFEVRAVDASGNKSAISTWEWTVDKIAPETSLTAGPTGTVNSTSASFEFTSNEQGTFVCSLDGAAPTACSSPKAYPSLAAGPHTFSVAAVDVANNKDQTPITRTWTVDTSAPTTNPGTTTTTNTGTTTTTTTNTGTNTGTTTNPVTPPPPPPPVAPFDPRVSSGFDYRGAKTRFTVLALRGLPTGTKVVVTCKGKGCTFKRKALTTSGTKLNVLKKLRKVVLRAGAVLQLTTTGPQGQKKVVTWKVRAGRGPVTSYRCAAPGAKLHGCA